MYLLEEFLFPILENTCSADRHKSSVTELKSEIQVPLNFCHSCYELHYFIIGDAELLASAKIEGEYCFKYLKQNRSNINDVLMAQNVWSYHSECLIELVVMSFSKLGSPGPCVHIIR